MPSTFGRTLKHAIFASAAAAALASAAQAVEYKRVETAEPKKVRECLAIAAYPEEKRYCRSKPPKTISLSALERWRRDPHYQNAIRYLHDRSRFRSVEVTVGDPESGGTMRKGVQKMPDYEKALDELYLSAKRHNALAASVGEGIVTAYMDLRNEKVRKYYGAFLRALYADRSCPGYVAYGDAAARDPKKAGKALKIYKEGYGLCKDVGFYGNVLGSRIAALEMKSKIRKGRR